MKHSAAILVLAGFLAMAVFGAALVEHTMLHHADCLASAVTGNPCPTKLMDFVLHHITALQAFSTSLPAVSGAALLVSVLFALVAFPISSRRAHSPPKLHLAYPRFGCLDSFRPLIQPRLIRWLASHENSPAAPIGR